MDDSGLTAQVGWRGLRVGGHPALSLHSSNEPGELSQWPRHDDSIINVVITISILTAANTEMGDRLRSGKPPQYFTKPPRPTQPPTLNRTGYEYQPKCGDALRLGSKDRYCSFHLRINVWVAGKTV